MQHDETLCHTKWECKYHVVFIPKYRRKALYTELRQHLREVFRSLAEQKECRIEEGHLMPDPVHMLISIPPKYSVPQVMGFIKGKAAIHMARTYMGRRKTLRVNGSGLGPIMSRPWVGMRPRSGLIFRDKKRKTNVSIRRNSGSRMPPLGG
jgi:REP element-mobilizing transposase RayT